MSASATKTFTLLRDVPQSVTVVSHDLIVDQNMQSLADVVRYVPGITMAQGEGNRDQPTIRGNTTSSDFFVDGVRDDIQFFRDLYNIDRVEAVTGASSTIFGRGSGGGVLNRVTKQPSWAPTRQLTLQGGSFDNKRASLDVGDGLTDALAVRVNGMYENSGSYRDDFRFKRYGINPTVTFSPGAHTSAITMSYEHFNDHRTADRGVPSFNGLPFNSDASTFFGDPNVSYANARVDAGEVTLVHAASLGIDHPESHAIGRVRQDLPERVSRCSQRGWDAGRDHWVQQRGATPQPVQSDRSHVSREHWCCDAHVPGRCRVGPAGDEQLQKHGVLQ